MENFDGEMLFDLKMLRVIAEAKIMTLEKYGDSDNLFRAQIVAKILEDDQCFAEMTLDEAVEVLMALGFKPDAARIQAAEFYQQYHNRPKKLSHMKKVSG